MNQKETQPKPRLKILEKFPYQWLALFASSIAAFLGPLEGNMIVISLPTLAREFGVSASHIVWVMIAGTLVTLSLALPIASMSDLVGRRRLFRFGFIIFSAGSILALLSSSLSTLIGARIVQGIGTGFFAATRNALAVEAFNDKKRGLAMGVILSCVGLGASTAPYLGGWLLTNFGWKAIFLAEIPISIFGAVVSFLILTPETIKKIDMSKFDISGSIIFFVFITASVFLGNRLPDLGITSPLVWFLIVLALVSALLFIRTEIRHTNPIINFGLFKNRTFLITTTSLIFQMFSFAIGINILPFFLENALGLSPAGAGAIFSVSAFALFIGSVPGGALFDRIGIKPIGITTLTIMTICFVMLSNLSISSSLVSIFATLLIFGMFEGAFQSATSAAQLASVPKGNISTAGALFIVGIMLPITLGLGIGGTVFSTRLEYHSINLGPGPLAVSAAYQEIALLGAFFAILSLVTYLFLKPEKQ